jgi:AMMECR1 domain-containing protein
MEPSPSPEVAPLTESEQRALIDVARQAVNRGLGGDMRWHPDRSGLTRRVLEPGATFVTLRRNGDLLGCIGTLQPSRPLVDDVASVEAIADIVRPGIDGLLLVSGSRRATFLPSVWEMVPEVDTFLRMLWEKAGLRPGSWPRHTTISHYSTIEFGT